MPTPFTSYTGQVVPLDRINVDTDQIIPKQFLKRIERSGFGRFLFNDWRFLTDGSTNPDFILNHDKYQNVTILVAGNNFGCGSSREHAPWALQDYGFKVIIAPSFADIFYPNCFKNGLLSVILPEAVVTDVLTEAAAQDTYSLTIDIDAQTVTEPDDTTHPFEIDPFRKQFIQKGLDEIGWTLQHEEDIAAFEAKE